MAKSNRLMVCLNLVLLLCLAIPVLADELSMSDKRFLKNAAEAGYFEVQGSGMAFKKSKDTALLKFAKMMTEDHGQANANLKTLAANKGVILPQEPSLMQQTKLKYLDMRDDVKFDRSYASIIGVSAHEQAVKLFEDASEDANDADVKKFAADTLPTLKKHLADAQRMDARLNKDD